MQTKADLRVGENMRPNPELSLALNPAQVCLDSQRLSQ
jgi:hypothetical protein